MRFPTPEPAGAHATGPATGAIVTELNNLLAAIHGHSAVALDALGDRHPVATKSVEEIRQASDRATHLMWELLGLEEAREEPAAEAVTERNGSEQNGAAGDGLRVLLVEDNDVVRSLVGEMLQNNGCEVLEAATPTQAIELSDNFHGPIDLLVTDMVMPHLNGRELAVQLLEARPSMSVLYTSRFANDALTDCGVLTPGTAFLQKPFSSVELASTVREVVRRGTVAPV